MKREYRRRLLHEQLGAMLLRRLGGLQENLERWARTEGILDKGESMVVSTTFWTKEHIIVRQPKSRTKRGEE